MKFLIILGFLFSFTTEASDVINECVDRSNRRNGIYFKLVDNDESHQPLYEAFIVYNGITYTEIYDCEDLEERDVEASISGSRYLRYKEHQRCSTVLVAKNRYDRGWVRNNKRHIELKIDLFFPEGGEVVLKSPENDIDVEMDVVCH